MHGAASKRFRQAAISILVWGLLFHPIPHWSIFTVADAANAGAPASELDRDELAEALIRSVGNRIEVWNDDGDDIDEAKTLAAAREVAETGFDYYQGCVSSGKYTSNDCVERTYFLVAHPHVLRTIDSDVERMSQRLLDLGVDPAVAEQELEKLRRCRTSTFIYLPADDDCFERLARAIQTTPDPPKVLGPLVAETEPPAPPPTEPVTEPAPSELVTVEGPAVASCVAGGLTEEQCRALIGGNFNDPSQQTASDCLYFATVVMGIPFGEALGACGRLAFDPPKEDLPAANDDPAPTVNVAGGPTPCPTITRDDEPFWAQASVVNPASLVLYEIGGAWGDMFASVAEWCPCGGNHGNSDKNKGKEKDKGDKDDDNDNKGENDKTKEREARDAEKQKADENQGITIISHEPLPAANNTGVGC